MTLTGALVFAINVAGAVLGSVSIGFIVAGRG